MGRATNELLEDLTRRGDGHATEVLRLASAEEVLETDLSEMGGGVDRVDDHADLALSVLVLDVLVVQVGDDLRRGLLVSVNKEPARGPGKHGERMPDDMKKEQAGSLRKHVGTKCEEDGEEDLERDGEAPTDGCVDERQSEVL